MTPTAARAALDRQLARHGQSATLRRLSAPDLTATDVTIRVHIVDFKPQEILGGVGLQTGDSRVIMSATEVEAAQWPSAAESRIPQKGDQIIVGGRTRTVLFAWPGPYVGGELVRIELAISK